MNNYYSDPRPFTSLSLNRSMAAYIISLQKTVPRMKLELFCLMEKESHTSQIHPVLEEVIMESILEAIDFVQTDQVHKTMCMCERGVECFGCFPILD